MPKVNWEKEIDEEIEKQKRKKKTIVEKKSLGSVEVPQLPKPTNRSPKPSRIVNSAENKKPEKKDSDLLGKSQFLVFKFFKAKIEMDLDFSKQYFFFNLNILSNN